VIVGRSNYVGVSEENPSEAYEERDPDDPTLRCAYSGPQWGSLSGVRWVRFHEDALFVTERLSWGNCGASIRSEKLHNERTIRQPIGGIMVLGMTLATFTLVHVLISLVGIGSGLVVMYGFLTANRLDRWTTLFLVSTAMTSITGFLFPFKGITPGIVIGVLSLIALASAVLSRYSRNLTGAWRPIYVVTASVALYFNVFVFVVQSFEKVPQLRVLAPTQKEPPFAVAQLLVLIAFVVVTGFAVKRFRTNANSAGKSDEASLKSQAA
jgi:hypothetical protein